MQILMFLIINFLGFLSVSVAVFYAQSLDILPVLPEDLLGQFQTLFFGGTMIAWIVGGILSIFFFFVRGSLKILFLFLPIIIPGIYAMFILNMFNT